MGIIEQMRLGVDKSATNELGKKYELLSNDTVQAWDACMAKDNPDAWHTCYRVRALRDFGHVKAGDLGGYIADERNLSHQGDCWVSENAKVFMSAVITGGALVSGNACVFDCAEVSGGAIVTGSAQVRGEAVVKDRVLVYENAEVSGKATVCEFAIIRGRARADENCIICGEAILEGSAIILGNKRIYGKMLVQDCRSKTPPKYLEVSDSSFCVVGPFSVKVDAITLTFPEWQERWEHVLRERYDEEIVQAFIQFFNDACSLFQMQKFRIDQAG